MRNPTSIILWTILFSFTQLSAQIPDRILVWEDQFNGPTINPSIWKNEVGDGCDKNNCGWGNAELEFYTSRAENVRIENGSLVIEARREAFQNRSFTSGRLKTEGLMQFKYGTIEARIKIPNVENGLWPAFWTLGTVGGPWPANGEIDMVELGSAQALASGLGNKRVGAATHWSVAGRGGDFPKVIDAAVNLSDDYHLYKMVWTSQFIKMYLDNVEYFSFDISGGAAADLSEFHNPHYLLLNLAVGGIYPGIFTTAGITAPLPGKMLIDYIKLYQGVGDELLAAANPQTPLTAAPTPTKPAGEVISLFSNVYTNVPVSTWSATWDNADVADIQVLGNATKLYSNLNFAGIEFINPQINATNQTHFHIDVWTANSTSFKVKLVDFGANGVFGGGDDKESELTFTPPKNIWKSYDIQLSNFIGLSSRAHLAQLILSGTTSTVYVDNVYFFKATMPINAAPTPTKPANTVTSLFSNAYINVPNIDWFPNWNQTTIVSDLFIEGNLTKKYTNMNYEGVQFSSPVNASAVTHLHIDLWTPNCTSFDVFLINTGLVTKEQKVTLTPTLAGWNSFDIPLASGVIQNVAN